MIRRLTAALLALSSAGCGDPAPPKPDLKASAQVSMVALRLTNNDSFVWGDCDIEINSHYERRKVSIPPGQNDLPLRDFTKKDGTRFNAFTTKPQRLYVYCRKTPHGTMSYGGEWR